MIMKFPNKNHIEIKGFLEGYSSEILNCFQTLIKYQKKQDGNLNLNYMKDYLKQLNI